MTVPCLSLWQPWASLLVHGVKRVETRPKRFNHTGVLLIHAAKSWTPDQAAVDRRYRTSFSQNLIDAQYDWWDNADLPLGAIVGAVVVERVERMTEELIAAQTSMERDMGDWRVGRWGIFCKAAAWLTKPVPFRGQQATPFPLDLNKLDAEGSVAVHALLARMKVIG